MSECVVRMEMPESCPCEFAGGYDIPLPCFAAHGVPKRCKEFDDCVENGTKPDWCPILAVLPEKHGRLVDADERFLGVIHFDGGGFANYNTTIAERIGEEGMRMVNVIVPATEGGKE